jgi:hypothetical protein
MFFSLYMKYSLFFSESAIPKRPVIKLAKTNMPKIIPTSLTLFLLSISILDSPFSQSPAQGGGEFWPQHEAHHKLICGCDNPYGMRKDSSLRAPLRGTF